MKKKNTKFFHSPISPVLDLLWLEKVNNTALSSFEICQLGLGFECFWVYRVIRIESGCPSTVTANWAAQKYTYKT